MTTKFYCFLCDNIDSQLVALHKEACELVGIDIQYVTFSVKEIESSGVSPHYMHGKFLEDILTEHPNEVVGFIDVDCIISSIDFLHTCLERLEKNKTILGTAQSANHLPTSNEIYASPAFWLVYPGAWGAVGKPRLSADQTRDTGQSFTFALRLHKKEPIILMPLRHSHREGSWKLGSESEFGIGTIYENGELFHLFQSHHGPSHVDLYEEKVQQLRQGSKLFT